MKKALFTLIGLSLLGFVTACNWNPQTDPYKVKYVEYFKPAPDQIVNRPPTSGSQTIEIHFYGDIMMSTFTLLDDIQINDIETPASYTGAAFFLGCIYYPLFGTDTPADTNCSVGAVGLSDSPKLVLTINDDRYDDLEGSDGHTLELQFLPNGSNLLTMADPPDTISPGWIRYKYRTNFLDGDGPYLMSNINLDSAPSSVYPYGFSQPVQFFPPHGKISGKIKGLPHAINFMIEPTQPEDFDVSGTYDEENDELAFQCSSEQGFPIDTDYDAVFLSNQTPFINLFPLIPPSEDENGEFLRCGPDCADPAKTVDTTGIEFQFHTSKVRIEDFPFQGYTLKIDSTSLPLSMEVVGTRKGEVNEVDLNVSASSVTSLPLLSTDLDTSSSFVRNNVEFLPADLEPLSTRDVRLTAQAHEGASEDAGSDYITYTYEPVPVGQSLHIYKLPVPNDDLVCVDYDGTETVEYFRFYVQEEREPDLGSVVYDNQGCTLTAMFTPQGPVEKLFAVAIVSEENKIAYISNRITITDDYPLNLPGKNFWADLSGDHELTGLDVALANNYFNYQTNFPRVMPHDGDSGAVAGHGWLTNWQFPTDVSLFEDIILSEITLEDEIVGGKPATNDFQVKSLLDGQSVEGRVIFVNIGGAAGVVNTRVWDYVNLYTGSVPVAGLGINYIWSGPVQIVNAFSKEIPSGTTFYPSTDDINGNGFQDCCYASHNTGDMNCSVAASNCALGVTWEIQNSPYLGYAVGPNQELPVLQNLSEVSWEGDPENVGLEVWIPSDPDISDSVTTAQLINFSIKVPKPQITMIGTKTVTPYATAMFNGVRQTISGEFPYYENLSSVGDNQTVTLAFESRDCFCYPFIGDAQVTGDTFQTLGPIDFAVQCGIPPSLMDCAFDVTATGHDSGGHPSLTSVNIPFQISPRIESIPPIISFPENNGIYNAETWTGVVAGEGASDSTINIYYDCVPNCSDPGGRGANCTSFLIGTTNPTLEGYWQATLNPDLSDGPHTLYAMSFQDGGDCMVGLPVSFLKDVNPPAVQITSYPFVLGYPLDDNPGDSDEDNPYPGYPYLAQTGGYFVEGSVTEARLTDASAQFVQLPSGPAYSFNDSLCSSTLNGAVLSFSCPIPDSLEPAATIGQLVDKAYKIRVSATDFDSHVTIEETPLVISRKPLLALTLNAIEQDRNGKIKARMNRCTGNPAMFIQTPPPPSIPFDLIVPPTGFDIDLAFSDLAIDLVADGLISLDSEGFEMYHDSNVPEGHVRVLHNDGSTTQAVLDIPPTTVTKMRTDIFGAIRDTEIEWQPYLDDIVAEYYGEFIRYFGSKSNLTNLPFGSYVPEDFPVMEFYTPTTPGQYNYTRYTLTGRLPLVINNKTVTYELDAAHGLDYTFYVGNTVETTANYGNYNDLLPFSGQGTSQPTIQQCFTMDHAAAEDRVLEGVFYRDALGNPGPSYYEDFDPCMPPDWWINDEYPGKTLHDYYYDREDPRYRSEIPEQYWTMMDRGISSDVAAVIYGPDGKTLREMVLEAGLRLGTRFWRIWVGGQEWDGSPPSNPEDYLNIHYAETFEERFSQSPSHTNYSYSRVNGTPTYLDYAPSSTPPPPLWPQLPGNGAPSGGGNSRPTSNNRFKDWGRISENPSWDSTVGIPGDVSTNVRDMNFAATRIIGEIGNIKDLCYKRPSYNCGNYPDPEDPDIIFLQNQYYWYGTHDGQPPLGMMLTSGGTDILDPTQNLDFIIITDYLNDEYVPSKDLNYATRYDTFFHWDEPAHQYGWIVHIFRNIGGHMAHEIGHRQLGVTYGVPPTGMFSGQSNINLYPPGANIYNARHHDEYPDGYLDCRFSMKDGAGCSGTFPWREPSPFIGIPPHAVFSPMEWAYYHHRVIINRKFDFITEYGESPPLCLFYPGADNPYAVQVDDYHSVWNNRRKIVAPGILGPD